MKAINRRYIAFFTSKQELIVQPTTSTAPVTYGYLPMCSEEQAMKILTDTHEIPVLRCNNFVWNSDNTMKKE